MKRFWEAVLAVNSTFVVITSAYLVYSFGMLIIALEWQRFLLVLAIWAVLVGMEMVLSGMLHT